MMTFKPPSNARFQLSHSWLDESGHIIRKKGVMRRCKIGKLDLNDGEVSIIVEFRGVNKKGMRTTFTKAVSPLLLLHANNFWKMTLAMSEIDVGDKDEFPVREFSQKEASLPIFEVYNAEQTLDLPRLRKLNWMIEQVQHAQILSTRIQLPTRVSLPSDTPSNTGEC